MQVPRYWRLKKQSYSLQGETCSRCGTHLFPPRAVCPHCASGPKEVAMYVEDQPVLTLVEQLQSIER